MYRAPTQRESTGLKTRHYTGLKERWCPKGTPLRGQVRRVGTMYRAPTQRESTGLKTRHYKGRKKDGALKGRRYEDKCEEWARCIVPLHGRGEGEPMRILLRRILEA